MIDLKEQRGVKHSTIVRYKELTTRIYPTIGHIKLRELRADQLNSLYTELAKPGTGKGSAHATSKMDLAALLKEKGITRAAIAEQSGVSLRAVYDAIKGKEVNMDAAKGISAVLGLALDKAFAIQEESRSLSTKTVLEHHRLISTVLDQAEKEGLVPFNVASKATAG